MTRLHRTPWEYEGISRPKAKILEGPKFARLHGISTSITLDQDVKFHLEILEKTTIRTGYKTKLWHYFHPQSG